MPRLIPSWVPLVLVLIVMTQSGCPEWGVLLDDVIRLKEQVRLAEEQAATARRQTEQNTAEIAWLVNQAPVCRNRKFGQDLVESCSNGRCDPGMLAKTIDGLRDNREIYQIVYLNPSIGATGLAPERMLDIEILFKQPYRPVTRLLVIGIPRQDGMEALAQAEKAASNVRKRIHDKLPQTQPIQSIISAFACTSVTRSRILQLTQQHPHKVGIEPLPKDALIVLIFRLDCF